MSPRRYAGTHAAPSRRTSGRSLRRGLLSAGIATTATGVVVAGGLFAGEGAAPLSGGRAGAIVGSPEAYVGASQLNVGDALDTAHLSGLAETTDRDRTAVSRSATTQPDASKLDALSTEPAPAKAYQEKVDNSDPRGIARALLGEYGFSADQFGCLDSLYMSESGWNMHADNPTSSAYGIPQALTETHDMPAGYFDSAEVQIRWGLNYIRDVYGSPCSAWDFKQSHQWY